MMSVEPKAKSVRILKQTPTRVKVQYLDDEVTVSLSRQFFYRRWQMGLFKVINKQELDSLQRF